MTERAAFEAWIRKEGHPLGIRDDGSYVGSTEVRWQAWQAAQAETAIEFRPAVNTLAEMSMLLTACRLVIKDDEAREYAGEVVKRARAQIDAIRTAYPSAFAAGGKEGK